jgi:hypothetical protein
MTPFQQRLDRARYAFRTRRALRNLRAETPDVRRSARRRPRWESAELRARILRNAVRASRLRPRPPRVALARFHGRKAWRVRVWGPRLTKRARMWRARARHWRECPPGFRAYYFATMAEESA